MAEFAKAGSLAIGGTNALLSARGASEDNEALSRTGASARNAAKVQTDQVRAGASLEREKRRRAAARIQGAIRVAAAEAGGSPAAGSFAAFARQARLDEGTDIDTINANEFGVTERIRTGLDADIAQLKSQSRNSILAAITGAAQGAAQGLAIGGQLDEFLRPDGNDVINRYQQLTEGSLTI